jgi:hypothetical protein
MARQKIDVQRLTVLLREQKTTSEIAAAFNVTAKSVTECCHRNELPLPVSKRAPHVADPRRVQLAVVPKPATIHPPRMATLIATGGRYADLAAWARAWGVTETKARQEWFALRLPVSKGASHG